MGENEWSAETVRRKLRAIASVLGDPAATENEKSNAKVLKLRLEQKLGAEAPASDFLFRLGRAVRDVKQSVDPPAPKGGWTDHAFRLGRLFRRGLKK